MGFVTTAEEEAPADSAGSDSHHARPGAQRVVLCGSFRRDCDGLRRVFDELSTKHEVLSPKSVDFALASLNTEFVRLPDQEDQSVHSIEQQHLDAIAEADFVFLHAPGGYVGSSAAFEVGWARANGVPIFALEAPGDEMLSTMVAVVPSVPMVDVLESRVGSSLPQLQSYYERVALERGWDEESARDTLLLLTEELGELARAVRKHEGLKRDSSAPVGDVGLELADMQLYLVHLANVLGVNLSEAVTAKESINRRRYENRPAA